MVDNPYLAIIIIIVVVIIICIVELYFEIKRYFEDESDSESYSVPPSPILPLQLPALPDLSHIIHDESPSDRSESVSPIGSQNISISPIVSEIGNVDELKIPFDLEPQPIEPIDYPGRGLNETYIATDSLIDETLKLLELQEMKKKKEEDND